ncbi:hypothetical protein VNO78_27394 [Psophocarpus tetragonolobus]|uniref:Fatty acid hydroxylase domain-containing protein n=1 Tax=Psophocarpus tetragonolobus TaxID=3891 RepID=A0AAN9S1H4_PSOTE
MDYCLIIHWLLNAAGLFCGKYRLHSKEDEDQKNLVTKGEVIRGVLSQQVVQAVVAIILFKVTGGNKTHEDTSNHNILVHVGLSAIKLVIAMIVMDTWQYWMHRVMHQKKFLYKHIHSQHHRLTVPYSFGALYNNPIEGFLLDTIGGALSFLASGITPRASIFFFSFATIKTVDDHCGFWLPRINPFHRFFYNNAAYPDVHHQFYGANYNFSQPFFSTWDRLLGTFMPYSVLQRDEGGFEARPSQD